MSPARRLLFSGLALVVVVGLAVALVARLLGRPDEGPARLAQDLPGTVVLVPGYGGSTSALQVLARRLQAAGREAVVVDLPGDGTGDLRESASAVDAVVASVIGQGAPSVDLVGYSAGGVTVRWWLQKLGGTAVTRRVLTLGAPHHGTGLARAGAAFGGAVCPEACQQLVPGSDLLEQLGDDETPDGPSYVALWTEQDETVTPPDSGRLDGAQSFSLQDVCPGLVVSHGDLPRSPLVAGIALAELGVAPVSRPTDCAGLTAAGA